MCSVMQLMISAFSFSETDTSSQEFWSCSISWFVGFTKSQFFTLLLAETVLQVSNKPWKWLSKIIHVFWWNVQKKIIGNLSHVIKNDILYIFTPFCNLKQYLNVLIWKGPPRNDLWNSFSLDLGVQMRWYLDWGSFRA